MTVSFPPPADPGNTWDNNRRWVYPTSPGYPMTPGYPASPNPGAPQPAVIAPQPPIIYHYYAFDETRLRQIICEEIRAALKVIREEIQAVKEQEE